MELRDHTVGNVLVLHAADLASISGTKNDPVYPPGVVPEHEVKSKL